MEINTKLNPGTIKDNNPKLLQIGKPLHIPTFSEIDEKFKIVGPPPNPRVEKQQVKKSNLKNKTKEKRFSSLSQVSPSMLKDQKKLSEYHLTNASIYITKGGELLSGLAHLYYGDYLKMYPLLRATPELGEMHLESTLKAGVEVLMPSHNDLTKKLPLVPGMVRSLIEEGCAAFIVRRDLNFDYRDLWRDENEKVSEPWGPGTHSFLMVVALDEKTLTVNSKIDNDSLGPKLYFTSLTGTLAGEGALKGKLIKLDKEPADRAAIDEFIANKKTLGSDDWDMKAKQLMPKSGSHKAMIQKIFSLYNQYQDDRRYHLLGSPASDALNDSHDTYDSTGLGDALQYTPVGLADYLVKKTGFLNRGYNCHNFSKTIASLAGAKEETYSIPLMVPGEALPKAELFGPLTAQQKKDYHDL